MSKITYEEKKGKIIIVNKLAYPEAVNERVFNAIISGMFDGFIPVSIRQKRKETRLECVIQGMIPLSQYLSGVVTKKMFLDFVHAVAVQIKNCEKNMINVNNLDLHRDLIFIDPQTKRVKCIYWPIVNNQRETPPSVFLKQLPASLNFYQNEDTRYLNAYNAFFAGVNPFSVNAFDKLVLQLSGRQATGSFSSPSEALSGKPIVAEKPDNTAADNKNNIAYDPFSAPANQAPVQPVVQQTAQKYQPDPNVTFCTECGVRNQANSNFCIQCGARLKKDAAPVQDQPKAVPFPIAGKSIANDDPGGTIVLGEDPVAITDNDFSGASIGSLFGGTVDSGNGINSAAPENNADANSVFGNTAAAGNAFAGNVDANNVFGNTAAAGNAFSGNVDANSVFSNTSAAADAVFGRTSIPVSNDPGGTIVLDGGSNMTGEAGGTMVLGGNFSDTTVVG